MTGQNILDHFITLIDDDTTTLSAAEQLILLNKSYRRLLNKRSWNFLTTTFTGTTSTTVPYIALPSDFKRFLPYNGEDDGRYSIFVGSYSTPYNLITQSDSYNYGNYNNADGFFYLDLKNSRLTFTKQPATAQTIVFPYIYRPADLTTVTSPIFDSDYHYALAHGMISDYYISDQTPKGRTYYQENEAKFDEYIQEMIMEDELITLT